MNSSVRKQRNIGLASNIIQGFLKLKDISQKEIARDASVTEECVSQVITRNTTSRPVREMIAQKLGLPYEFVWGDEPQERQA